MSYTIGFYYSGSLIWEPEDPVVNVGVKKLSGSTYFSVVPQMVTVVMYESEFILNTLINDVGIGKNVSNYEMRVSFSGSKIFTGRVDLSSIKRNVKHNEVSVSAYDNVWFISKFTDIEIEFEDEEGITPTPFMNAFLSAIDEELGETTGIGFDNQSSFSLSQVDINGSILRINTFDPEDFAERAISNIPNKGSDFQSGDVPDEARVVMATSKFLTSPDNPRQAILMRLARVKSTVYLKEDSYGYSEDEEFFQYNIYAEFYQYYNIGGWKERKDLTIDIKYIWDFDAPTGTQTPQAASLNKYTYLKATGTADSYLVNSAGGWYGWGISDRTIPVYVPATSSALTGCSVRVTRGLRDYSFMPEIESYRDPDNWIVDIRRYNALNTLKGMLMYYDYTLFADANGNLIMINKVRSGTLISIARSDYEEYSFTRHSQDYGELSELSNLYGDQTGNQIIHKSINSNVLDSLTSISAIITNSGYDLDINKTISDPITGNDYVIYEFAHDKFDDRFIIKAWRKDE